MLPIIAGRAEGTKRWWTGLSLFTRHSSLILALVTCHLLLLPRVSFSVALEGPEGARRAYERAVRMRTALESRPDHTRPKADYEKLIRAFQAVYRYDPAYRKAPAALAAVGEVYEEMAREFSSDDYYTASIKAYQFLISQYPQSAVSRDALFTIGEIYRSDLKNPDEARKAFQKFLRQYPSSTKAAAAEEARKQIDRALAKRARSEFAFRPSGDETQRADRISEVNAIHHWVGPDYSRIVIGVEDEVKFNATRLGNPDRLVFDLSNTRLSASLVGKTFPVEDGFLRQIRIAQYKPFVTRVVLDVERIEDYSVFSLPNPFRLVIDIHGARVLARKSYPSNSVEAVPDRIGTGRESSLPGALGRERTPKRTGIPGGSGDSVAQGPLAHNSDVATRRPNPTEAMSESESAARPGSERTPTTEAGRQHPLGDREERVSGSVPKSPPEHPSAAEPDRRSLGASRETESAVRPAAPTETGSRTLTRALGLKIARIAIDPGHGGHDTGTIGPGGLREKDLVLDVALRLKKLIENKMESEVIMTRSDDTFIALEERTAIANQKAADLFISIHANASRDSSARGVETYYLNFTSSPEALEVAARENATSQESVHKLQKLIEKIARTEKIEESKEFAQQIQRALYTQTARAGVEQRDRGLKKAPFVVLIGANMPSILAEISFLTNPGDERLLRRANYRQKIAEALYRGVARYVNNLGEVKLAQESPAFRTRLGELRGPARPGSTRSARQSSPGSPASAAKF